MIKKLFLMFFFLNVFAFTALAQLGPEQSIVNARDQFFDIKNRSIEMERVKRDANKRPDNSDSTVKFPEIKEDFEQIQKLNSQIFQLTSAKTPTDFTAVHKFAAELNHRAERLKANLFPEESKPKNKKQNQSEIQDIKPLLNNLDKSINSFVHSSLFQNINLVNSEDTLKAKKDLETVIKVSNAIKAKMKSQFSNDSEK